MRVNGHHPSDQDRLAAYGMAAMNSASERVRFAAHGTGNDTLNECAFGLAQLVGAGALSEEEIHNNLTEAALAAGLTRSEINSTLKSAIRAGLAEPRQIEPKSRIRTPRSATATKPRQQPVFDLGQYRARCKSAQSDNAYLIRKAMAPDGLLAAAPMTVAGRNVAGWLAVPAYGLEGDLQTLQFISAQGEKLSAPGHQIGGAVFVCNGGDGRPTHDVFAAGEITLVEGVGTADAAYRATGKPAMAAFGKSNLDNVARALRGRHPDLKIIIAPDAGQEDLAERICREIGAPSGWCPMPAGSDANSDLNDLAVGEAGLEAVRKVLADVRQPAPAQPMKFKLAPVSEVCARAYPDWIIPDLVPAVGTGVLYGESGSGKSFAKLDMAIRFVMGWPYAGRRTKRARVVYVVLEGSLRTRLEASKKFHNLTNADLDGFSVIEGIPMDLLVEGEAETFINDLRLGLGEYDRLVVVIDTLARAMPGGNENTSEDMGRLIAAADRIYRELHAMVILVHHSGKDTARGARGWSGLRAAMDLEIEVARDGDNRTLTFSKVKDGLDGISHEFKLEVVDLGARREHDPEADPAERITSCVAVVGEQVSKSSKAAKDPIQTNAFLVALKSQGGKANKSEFRKLLTEGENRIMSKSTFYFVAGELERQEKLDCGLSTYTLIAGEK